MVVSGLTQGCTPIGAPHVITEAEGARGLVKTIDDRPAVAVLREDIGELLARDLRRIGGYIFAGLPIAGSDTGDYPARNTVRTEQHTSELQSLRPTTISFLRLKK